MKKTCYIILAFLSFTMPAQAQEAQGTSPVDELTSAYQREILFLSTYKRELKNKIESVEKNLSSKVRDGEFALTKLENKWLSLQTSNELLMQKYSGIESDFENRKENKEILETTLKQSLVDLQGSEEQKTDGEKTLVDQLESSLNSALGRLENGSRISKSSGPFYLKNGELAEGEIIEVGSFARFGAKDGKIASLYPSGQGTFRVWNWLGGEEHSLLNNELPKNLSLFLFDNPDKEFMPQKEKSTLDVVQSGGLIGWIIVLMGVFSLMVSGFRFYLLEKAKLKNETVAQQATQFVEAKEFEKAQHVLINESSSVARVLTKTLSFLRSEPSKVEDAIQESIIKESQIIDRFGVVLLVIASVAPLMGLLGTVTGMISTFDIITLYGTGNPKLLSGGISEALVTTMLGLIVAIPSLLIGQYLNSKNEKLKSDMEKWALALCNSFKNSQ